MGFIELLRNKTLLQINETRITIHYILPERLPLQQCYGRYNIVVPIRRLRYFMPIRRRKTDDGAHDTV